MLRRKSIFAALVACLVITPTERLSWADGPNGDGATSKSTAEIASSTQSAGPSQNPPPAPENPKSTTAADSQTPAKAAGTRDLSDAEKIAGLRRTLESNKKQIQELTKERDDPKGEYAQAEADFNKIDDQLSKKKKALDEARQDGHDDEVDAIQKEIDALRKPWQLAKDRFDLAIQQRRAITEQIATLQKIVEGDQKHLDRLLGTETDTAPTEPPSKPSESSAPATTPATPKAEPKSETTAPTPQPDSPSSLIPGAAGLPSTAAPSPTNTPATATTPERKKRESQALTQAEQEAQRKADEASKAESKAQSIEERLKILDRSIALEKDLLDTARKLADNTRQARDVQTEDFREKSFAGAPAPELRTLSQKIQETNARLRKIENEVRERSNRLEELQQERSAVLEAQLRARQEAEKSRAELEQAKARVQQLSNPFSPHNLLQWLLDHGPKIVAILLAMLLLKWLMRLFNDQVVRVVAKRGMRGSKAERQDRANTLVSVFHNAASLAIYVGGTLMVLEEAGIPIAPLLGGAAVVGLAVAFGAQNLIRDYFYGFMILLENQYKLNDVIKIGEHSGQVEKITLRMTALRDLEGSLHFIPNGQITAVTNMTHGWSRALFNINVAYEEDVDRVMDLLVQLGKEMRSDPAYRLLILEDPTMLGVDNFADSAIVITFFIKTLPLQQWTVKRELLRRIKNKFDELGIEIPFPHRTLYHRSDDPRLLERLAARGDGHDGFDRAS